MQVEMSSAVCEEFIKFLVYKAQKAEELAAYNKQEWEKARGEVLLLQRVEMSRQSEIPMPVTPNPHVTEKLDPAYYGVKAKK